MRGWFWAMVVFLAGCYTEVDVDGEDNGVFFPSLRASVPLGGRPAPREGETDPAAVDSGNRLEFELTGTSGSDTQTLNAGDVIHFEGSSFFGPGDVAVDWDLYTASALVRLRWEAVRTLWLDGLTGLAATYVDTEVARGAETARDSDFTLGPEFGFRATWQPHQVVGVYGQALLYWGFGSEGPASMGTAELGATARVSGVTTFLLGWRWQSYNQDRSGSDLNLDMSGPLLGVSFDF
jgi:hypothetical protein